MCSSKRIAYLSTKLLENKNQHENKTPIFFSILRTSATSRSASTRTESDNKEAWQILHY